MFPARTHANGVPWLEWSDEHSWQCKGCGGQGELRRFTTVSAFANQLGSLKRTHASCGGGVPELLEGQVGHPLNPFRIER